MTTKWWKESVVYQIYPRSFQDSNGDGIGDLRGIIEKLDYLKELGVDVVWLSPVYKSPNDDNGYDISDYQDIMDEFGTLADWDELLAGDARTRHQAGDGPRRQPQLRRAPVVRREPQVARTIPTATTISGGRPRTARSRTTGHPSSAARPGSTTRRPDEYYLHLFSKKQPDLNWENPTVSGTRSTR